MGTRTSGTSAAPSDAPTASTRPRPRGHSRDRSVRRRPSRQLAGPRADTPTRKILIVDDNTAIHDDFRAILASNDESEGESDFEALEANILGTEPSAAQGARYQLKSVFGGEDALRAVEKAVAEGDPFQLVFLDMRMPKGWDGLQTAVRLLETDPLVMERVVAEELARGRPGTVIYRFDE